MMHRSFLLRSVVKTSWLSLLIALGHSPRSMAASAATQASAASAASAEQLLKDSDRARGALEGGITWEIDVDNIEDGHTNSVHYLVKVKGVDAVSEATAPARNKGEMMLFNDRNLWYFKPGLKKPMAISARQKLMGQAANGDIASTNYYRDYEGKIVGEDKVASIDCFRLELKARAKNVTYDGIRYWISKSAHLGIKAEFLTVGGDVFKSATFKYDNHLIVDGKDFAFVSIMDIADTLKPGNHTVLKYHKPRPETLPDSIFNVNNLVR